ncbi:MAG TPA: SDR family oxidoreductase [Ignavibacteria bacterium]|nr:SDR family oxidoreductase [Ignavibacteria bacterium]
MSDNRKTAFITGATGGLGFSFVDVLAADKYDLLLTGRDVSRLEEIKTIVKKKYGIDAEIFEADLTKYSGLEKIKDILDNRNHGIDIFINNAGFGISGCFENTDYLIEQDIISVNCSALTFLTKVAVRNMKRFGGGKILNVASTAAFKPGPMMSVYYASKSYVLSFSLAVSAELKKSDISISVLCPGPLNTGFLGKAFSGASVPAPVVKTAEPVYAARYGYMQMLKGRRLIIPGTRNRILHFVASVLPAGFLADLLFKIKKEKSD